MSYSTNTSFKADGTYHDRHANQQQPSSSDFVNKRHSDQYKDGVGTGRDKTTQGWVRQTKETEESAGIIEERVETSELTGGL